MSIKKASVQTIANRSIGSAEATSANVTTQGGGGAASISISSVSITNSSYVPVTPTTSFLNTTGGYLSIFGVGFNSNCLVFANSVPPITSTYITSTQINAQFGAFNTNSVTTQIISVVNTLTNSSGILISVVPITLTFIGSNIISSPTPIYASLAAVVPEVSYSALTYTILSGTMPLGYFFNTSTGIISGVSSTSTSTTLTIQVSNQQNQSNTQTITLNLIGSDPYYNYTSLLLNGETNTSTYIVDASTNTFALTVTGAATPNRFSPLWGNGYYGNYFDGSTGYFAALSSTQFTFGTNNFTVEGWFYLTGLNSTADGIFQQGTSSFPASTTNSVAFATVSTTNFQIYANNINTTFSPAVVPVLNQWYHFAIVRNSGTTTAYLNGVSKLSISDATNYTGTYFGIGNIYGSNAYYMNGYISNFRVVNGTAVYTSAFTPPTTPLTAIANTALLTCQSANFVDNSTNAFTLTPASTVKVVPNQPFGALPSGVQNYGSSLFDGSTGYLSSPGSTAFTFGTGDYTVEYWVYFLNVPGSGYSAICGSGTTTNGFGFGIAATKLYMTTSATGYGSTNNTILPNQWYHVAWVRRSGATNAYLNGTLDYSPTSGGVNVTETGFAIGAAGSSGYYSNAYISNLRVVKGTAVYTSNFIPPTAPLTAIANTSLLTLQNKNGINNNTFYDDSVNNFPITRTGTPTQGSFSPFSVSNWSYYTNGSNTGPSIPAGSIPNLSGAFTMECWAYYTAGGMLFGSWVNSGTAWGLFLQNTAFNGSYFYFYYGVYGTSQGTIGSNLSVPTSTWVHLAVSRDISNNWYFFVNGQTQPVVTFSLPISTLTFANSPTMYIGTVASVNAFTGYISNLRVVNSTTLYTSNFTPTVAPLTNITNTVLLTAQNGQFVDNSQRNIIVTGNSGQSIPFSPFASTTTYNVATTGGSIYLNGATPGAVSAPNSAAYFTSNNFTVECWVYFTTNSAGYQPILMQTGTADCQGIVLYIESNNTITSQLIGNGSSWLYSITTTVVPPLGWSHIAVTRNGGTCYLYLNGVLLNSTSISGSSLQSTTGGGFYVGYYPYFPGGARTFAGYITNVRLINGQALYYVTNFIPQSQVLPINNYLSYNSGNSFLFNGSSSYLTIPANSVEEFGANNFTIEFYWYPNSVSVRQWFYHANTDWWFGIDFYGTSAVMGLWASSNGTSWDLINSDSNGNGISTGSPILAAWNHVAVGRNGSNWAMWLNGTRVLGLSGISGSITNRSAQAKTIGAWAPAGSGGPKYYVNGYLSNFRIINGTDIYGVNNTAISVSTVTLTTTTNTILLTLQNSTLIDNSINNFTITNINSVTTSTVSPFGVITTITNTASIMLSLSGSNAGVVDQTGGSNLITIGGVQTITSSTGSTSSIVKYGSNSIYLDGSTGYIYVPYKPQLSLSVLPSFTIELWIKTASVTQYATIMGNTISSFTTGDWSFMMNYVSASAGDVALYVNEYSSGAPLLYTTGAAINDNNWHHVALVRNTSTWAIYIDGIPRARVVNTVTVSATTNYMHIGHDPYYGRFLSGYIDDFRFSSNVARYTSTFTPLISQLPTVSPYLNSGNTIPVTYLLVGGGGGAAAGNGGGGGAGGVATGTISLTLGASYNILIGAGGVGGGINQVTSAYPGANTLLYTPTAFTTNIAYGGGSSGGQNDIASTGGGSGGGGGGGTNQPSQETGQTGVPGQGYSGAGGVQNSRGGGGGGAGGPGNVLNGGTGTVINIISTAAATALNIGQYITATNSIYIGGGGGAGTTSAGGGLGGIGGGGAGYQYNVSPGQSGQAYTGGGGGGPGGSLAPAFNTFAGGNGGSGLVILSYTSTYQIAVGGSVSSYSTGSVTYWVHAFTASNTILF